MEHAGKSCNEVNPQRLLEQEARRQTDEMSDISAISNYEYEHFSNDKLCRALMLICPSCSTRIVKSEGCNFMTCPCGFKMCYVCKKGDVTQSHFG